MPLLYHTSLQFDINDNIIKDDIDPGYGKTYISFNGISPWSDKSPVEVEYGRIVFLKHEISESSPTVHKLWKDVTPESFIKGDFLDYTTNQETNKTTTVTIKYRVKDNVCQYVFAYEKNKFDDSSSSSDGSNEDVSCQPSFFKMACVGIDRANKTNGVIIGREQNFVFIDNNLVSVLSDKLIPHKPEKTDLCYTRAPVIISGSDVTFIDGKPVAREIDKVSCSHILQVTSQDFCFSS